MTDQSSSPATYGQLFRGGIVRSIKAVSGQIDPHNDAPLSSQIRDRVLNVLTFGLQHPAAWVETRQLLITLSPKMEQAGYWSNWLAYLHNGLTLSRTVQDVATEAALCLQIGLFCQRQGLLDQAKEWYERSCDLACQSSQTETMAAALNRLGITACLQRKDQQASAYVEQALTILSIESIEREFSYFIQGLIALNQRVWDEAVEHLQRSIAICECQANKRIMAIRLNSLGVAYQENGNYDEAQTTYQQTEAVLAEVNDPIELAILHINQGITADLMGNLGQALEYYARAQPALQKIQNGLNLAKLYNNQAYVYYQMRRWKQAEFFYQASLEQWSQLDNPIEYANVLDGLGLVYQKQNQFVLAKQTFRDALQHLTDTEDGPGLRYLKQEITAHLDETKCLLVIHLCAADCRLMTSS